MKADTFQLARDIVQGKWLVSNPDRLLPIARSFLNKTPVEMEVKAASVTTVSDSGALPEKAKRLAIIPLHGTMTKYDTCESYGTTFIAKRLREMADDENVIGIILDIDSPGGSSSAIPPMIEAISHAKAAGKPVYAHVDFCASAAYWVASQCDAIYMDNDLSEVGSIGAMAVFIDSTAANPTTGEKTIVIYAEESPDKNFAYREALSGRYEAAKAELKPLVDQFRDAVVAGRPTIHKDQDGVLSGKMFGTAEALRLNMADAKKTLSETIEAVFALASI
jgi:protease-4